MECCNKTPEDYFGSLLVSRTKGGRWPQLVGSAGRLGTNAGNELPIGR